VGAVTGDGGRCTTTAAAPAPTPASVPAAIPAETSAEPHADKGYSLIDHMDDPVPEENMGAWIERRIAEAREPFQPWDEMLTGIKAGKWKTQKELAATYHKPAKWTTQFKRVVLAQKVMGLAE